ncbi:hypothetical protein CkaCkLH20_08612 [Colletotrichum karsti]|uniref:SnoaL-like domain-containing protein n=1 Tax=Colletotrichum karsti TaxID=1095194 RepID=A0A9P6HYF6_9PEZI|nr:uncharacterized protein CkaCkLH20_08612 [Colletotrichum karsti]KAF9873878.1 hypothetical protein CkaCkLH20_08612 [Colletotrichum karsti]
MKPSHLLPLVPLVPLVAAVDMTPYKPSPDVDAAFAAFVEEYYLTSEDKNATTTFTDFWPADNGQLIIAGRTFSGSAAMLGVKQSLLPPAGNKSWWHLIRGASVAGESGESKTFVADIVIQTTGNASFTILKDEQGSPRLEPHSGSLSVYNLTVSTTDSPTDIPCSSS